MLWMLSCIHIFQPLLLCHYFLGVFQYLNAHGNNYQSTNVWREQNPVGSQSFIKLPVSCVFLIRTSPQICGTSKLRDIWANVLGLSRPRLLRLFCWIWFLLKINKSPIYLVLKENYHFSFLIILQSQVTCVTLNSLGRSVMHIIHHVCYYIILIKCLFLLSEFVWV